jgi:hypothetical protein
VVSVGHGANASILQVEAFDLNRRLPMFYLFSVTFDGLCEIEKKGSLTEPLFGVCC